MDTSKTVFSKGRDGWQGTDEIDMQQSATDYQGAYNNANAHMARQNRRQP